MNRKYAIGGAVLLLAGVLNGAMAQDHDRAGIVRGGPHFDGRYHHDHYYPVRGYVGPLPVGAVSVAFHGDNYFFHGGVWWRPYGGSYIVVTPPLGIFTPILPPDSVPLYIGGVTYYYADGTYYSEVVGQGYQVVAQPAGADIAQRASPPVPATAPDPIFYPRNNQSPAQAEEDRRACNAWATSQPNAMADAKVFQRAAEACMDGRGYTVR